MSEYSGHSENVSDAKKVNDLIDENINAPDIMKFTFLQAVRSHCLKVLMELKIEHNPLYLDKKVDKDLQKMSIREMEDIRVKYNAAMRQHSLLRNTLNTKARIENLEAYMWQIDMKLHIATEIHKEREELRKILFDYDTKLRDAVLLMKSFRDNCINVCKAFHKNAKTEGKGPLQTIVAIENLLSQAEFHSDGTVKAIGKYVKVNEASKPVLKRKRELFLPSTIPKKRHTDGDNKD